MKRILFDWRLWLLLYALQIPSLRALVKYLPDSLHSLVSLYFLFALAGYAWALQRGSSWRFFASRAALIALVALHVSLNLVIYPQADALKFQGRGSPQDDALIVGGERLAHGLNPYEGETFKSEWVSAGPGWVALALPFTLTNAFALFTPCWFAVTAIVICRWYSLRVATLFLLLLLSSPLVWELSVTGSDMLAMGCAFLLLTLWSYRAWTSGGIVTKLFSSLFAASVTTSRIVFGYLLALVSGFLLRKSAKSALAHGAATLGLFILLQLPFYLWNPERYFPLTRFFWAKGMLSPALETLSLITTALALLYLVLKTELSERAWIKGALLSLLLTMFWSALGDLHMRDYSLAEWEGANYFGPLIPLAIFFVATTLAPRTTS